MEYPEKENNITFMHYPFDEIILNVVLIWTFLCNWVYWSGWKIRGDYYTMGL